MAINKTIVVISSLLVVVLLGIFVWKGLGINKNKDQIVQTDGLTVVNLSASRMGNYSPNVINIKLGSKLRIVGDPKTLSGSMGMVIVDGYDISKEILDKDNVLEFTADKAGSYKIHCANGMGNGMLIVQ